MIVLIVIYFLICILHLSWCVVNPEGFWGFMVVLDVLRIAIIIIVFLVLCVCGLFLFFDQLWKIFKGKLKIMSFIKGFGLALILIFILMLNSVFHTGLSYLLSTKISEEYSYLEVSEDLIESGQTVKANSFARNAYLKENHKEYSSIFFMTKLLTMSEYNQKQRMLSKYEATVNYAYCQTHISGNSNYAERLYNEALTILDKELFSKEEKKDRSLFSFLALSNIKFEQNQFADSERYFNNVFKSVELFSKKDFKYISMSYILMMDRASKYGDLKRVKTLCYELLDKYKKSGMSLESREYLQYLQILLGTELKLGNKQAVSKFIHIANPIAEKYEDEKIFQKSQRIKVQYFIWLASLNDYDGSFEKGKGFWSWLFSSEEKFLTKKHKSIELAQNSLLEIFDLSLKPRGKYFTDIEILDYYSFYNILVLKGENKQAYQLLKSISKYINPRSTYTVSLDIQFLIALSESKQSNSKMKKMDDLMMIIFNNFYNQFAVLSDIDRETLLLKFEKKINSINKLYIQKGEDYNERILNNSIKVKGLSLLSQRQINQYLNSLQNPKVKKYQVLSEEYRKLQNEVSLKGRMRLEKVRSNLFSLHQQLDILGLLMDGLKLNVSWKDIRSKITKEELAVEIIRVPNQDESKFIYYAMVFTANSIKPTLVKLFSESEIESVLNCKGNTENRIKCILETKLEKINDLIFDPISKYTKDKNVIYISQAGLLHVLPLGSVTIDKPWTVKNVTSLQSILCDKINFRTNGATLLGGVEFGGYDLDKRNFRNLVPLDFKKNIHNNKISNLTYTKTEVLEIKKLYESYRIGNSIYLGVNANELMFRSLSGKKNDILHIATHGFSEGQSYNVNSTFNTNNNAVSELLRSGILLSPHSSVKGLNDLNDGLITAMDLSKLDLSNYNLAIFSSCESGVGNLYGSQGVFGIIRGLKSAGVKSMILSLWQVPDKQTSELMIAFYKYYLKGDHPDEALKKAKNEMKLIHPNPYFWAGFEYFE